ncbi:HpcH/HpaI aldolase [Pyricularia oryzae 70-15]|uniref:HpcH/HpaI aldolase n=1 Tax=Pyricularia oryzae (strain 70-15 / ATCC MYA-4617 / FGSC 8958) TaxID=242507 RepID=G4N452_PYRO7|nr:HpcH/HpaI aldolase [Pyricularia oryzae 70-15]EHA52772.1 HpcH/HpaI aldolase [Pyricularia oryzae 70-15]
MGMFANNLIRKAAAGQLCKAFGVKAMAHPTIATLVKNAGYDSLFIDLEHSNLSISDASILSHASLNAGLTPFVRVPHQCGNGFVQRVLDGGAMGVIFPHVSSVEDAKAAVSISKYPPQGVRSMTGQLPIFNLEAVPQATVIAEGNTLGSTVLVMIEDKRAVANVDAIAAVPGVDVLLVGSNDLAIDLGAPGAFTTPEFRSALEAIAAACKKHGKIMALAGIYDQPEIQGWVVRTLGAKYLLCQQDTAVVASGALNALRAVELNVEKPAN